MINSGSGLYNHRNCKFEVRESQVLNGGLGVYLKPGYRMYDGEYITEYFGTSIPRIRLRTLTYDQKRYTMDCDGVIVQSSGQLISNRGFGAFINSSKTPERPSNVTSISEAGHIFIKAKLGYKTPFVTGPFELYLAYGVEYWAYVKKHGEVHN